MDGPIPERRRGLPSVQRLLEQPDAARLIDRFGRASVVGALRAALEEARAALRDGAASPGLDALLTQAERLLDAAPHRGLVRVINATGIILHTNLGRAPLPGAAMAAVAEAAGYCSLEFDLAAGSRGSRTQGVEPLLRELTGAEAALAVNNAAAAVLLALAALAGSGEVVVSRGELVEIGGGFRIPDVIRQGGARLVEVGTTNKTRLSDYRAAIGPETRVLLKVHQSNFRMTGFTEQVPVAGARAAGARARAAPGARSRQRRGGRPAPLRPLAETTVREVGRGRGRPGGVQRRQAAGRTAGRAAGRPRRAGGRDAPASAAARAAARQAVARRAGGGLAPLRDGPRERGAGVAHDGTGVAAAAGAGRALGRADRR